MDSFITFCAKYLVIVPVLAVVYLAYRLKKENRKNFVILLVAGGALSYLLAKIGHHFYNDPRPFIADPHVKPLFDSSHDNGFPSDHTLLAAFLAFAALYYSRLIGGLLVVVALLVAWGRVAGHVHHLKDVLGSIVISALAAFIVMQVIKRKTPPVRERSSD